MLANIVRSAVLSLALAAGCSTTNNYYYYDGIQAKGCEEQSDCRPVEDCSLNSDLGANVCYDGSGVADYSDEASEDGSDCGDSELYGTFLVNFVSCNQGYHFREDCAVGMVEGNSTEYDYNDGITYDGLELLFTDGSEGVFDLTFRFEERTDWVRQVNEVMDEYNGYASRLWMGGSGCKREDPNDCIVVIPVEESWEGKASCRAEPYFVPR